MEKRHSIFSKALSIVLAVIITGSMFVIGSFAETTDIPDDAVEFNGNFYKMYSNVVSWSEAKDMCESYGGHLVTITSKEENDFICNNLPLQDDSYWIGASSDESYNYYWVTGESWSYENWAPDEPSNTVQHYVCLYGKVRSYYGTWDDRWDVAGYCDGLGGAANGFICEWERGEATAVEFNGHSYKLFKDVVSWSEAKALCESYGGYLATITSQEENDFICENLPISGNSYWIGASSDENYNYSWVTGEKWDYENWAPNEPSNTVQHYVCLYGMEHEGATKWDDRWDVADRQGELIGAHSGFICEWGDEGAHFPAGYDFAKDKLSFTNYGEKISKEYFTTLYDPASGEILYNEKANVSKEGLCYGFAVVTANLFNGYPTSSNITSGSSINLSTNQLLLNPTSVLIGQKEISLEDYIKYGFIYQWSVEDMESADFYQMVDEGKLGYVLGIHTKKDGHAVLAVGYENNGDEQIVYIDDSNEKDIQKLIINNNTDDWYYSTSWGFFKINSSNATLSYSSHPENVYNALATGKNLTVCNSSLGNESYISCEKKLGEGYALCYVDSIGIETNCTEVVDVSDNYTGTEDGSENQEYSLQWLKEQDTPIVVSNLQKKVNNISIGKGNTKVDAVLSSGSEFQLSFDEQQKADINVSTKKNDNIELTVSDVQEFDSSGIKINATASSDNVVVTQTDEGINISGIAEGTISLLVDDVVVATEEINCADGEIEITYDKTGEDTEIKTDYEVNHEYASEITTPATCIAEGVKTFTCVDCGDTYTENIEKIPHSYSQNIVSPTCSAKGYTEFTCSVCGDTYQDNFVEKTAHNYENGVCSVCNAKCSHLCHKSGFLGFIWKIVNLFNKLFKINQYCECGARHW